MTEASADIVAIAGGTRTRMSQDYGEDTYEFTATGQTQFQIRASLRNEISADSGVPLVVADAEIFVHHFLASRTDEQAYVVGQMRTDQEALLQKTFWESMAAVYQVAAGEGAGPIVNTFPTRTGKILTYSIGVQFALAP